MTENIRIISWNTCHQSEAWHMLANLSADVCLLQEAIEPSEETKSKIEIDPAPWNTEGLQSNWRTAIARLSDRVRMFPFTPAHIGTYESGKVVVSRLGTLSIADIEVVSTGEKITFASMYSGWEWPNEGTEKSWIFADASAHRLVSDLSALFHRQRGYKIIAAGDLNILYGYGEDGSAYWKRRYETIFSRMKAIGMNFVGPQAPNGGSQALPWPLELPKESQNVVTRRTNKNRPETGTRQLDFVFATDTLVNRVEVRALNSEDEWGLSDHCMIEINLSS
jgi:endonuclease/exonuclease/phosphatase family metal-dependent hydrolase